MAVFDWIAGVLRDSGQTLVGLGGLGIAALTVWLGHRERTKELRQRLFDARVDASIEIAAAAQALLDAAMDDGEAAQESVPESGVWGDAFRRSFEASLKLRERTLRYSVVVERRHDESPVEVRERATRVTGYPYPWGSDPDVSPDAVADMRASYEALIRALREMLGVDALTAETLRLLGKTGSPRESRAGRQAGTSMQEPANGVTESSAAMTGGPDATRPIGDRLDQRRRAELKPRS
jgi:hypothetical protein